MDPQFYPDSFDVRDSRLSTMILDSMIAMNLHIRGEKIEPEYEQAIIELSKMFNDLSRNDDIDPTDMMVLTRLYWPSSERYPEVLRGKTIRNLQIRSWGFAKDIKGFKTSSEEKQKGIIKDCSNLHRDVIVEYHRISGRYDLAA